MADKRASAGSKIVTALVGAGAAFAARKLLFFGWTKITGKEPPEHPEDPQVALGEALKGERREGLEIFTKVFWPTGPGRNARTVVVLGRRGPAPGQRVIPVCPSEYRPGCGQTHRPWGPSPTGIVARRRPVCVSMAYTTAL